jgi:hypothetical protein
MSNTPAVNSPTIQSAPRDPAQLQAMGRFHLRRLAETLGLLSTDALKSAFMAFSPNEMAQAIYKQLQAWDAQNGGAAPPPPQQPPPVATALAPAAAPPAAAETPARQPRTKATTANGSDHSDISQLMAALAGIAEEQKRQATRIEQIATLIDKSGKETSAIGEVVGQIHNTQVVGVALSLMLAEEVLKAPRPEVLEAAMADTSGIAGMLSGK